MELNQRGRVDLQMIDVKNVPTWYSRHEALLRADYEFHLVFLVTLAAPIVAMVSTGVAMPSLVPLCLLVNATSSLLINELLLHPRRIGCGELEDENDDNLDEITPIVLQYRKLHKIQANQRKQTFLSKK